MLAALGETAASDDFEHWRTGLPLPKGEGRGEGKQRYRKSQARRYAR